MTTTRRERIIASLDGRAVDILVVGGGIQGAFAAYESARRGLTTVLVDREDFGAGSSANSMRILHSGFRYLRSLDLRRLRSSSREVRVLTSMAPAFVTPLSAVVAAESTFGGKFALRAAVSMFRLATADLPKARFGISVRPRMLEPGEYRSFAGRFAASADTPALLWTDGFLNNSERLLMTVIRAAEELGAVVLNYAQPTGLSPGKGGRGSVSVVDRTEGNEIRILPRAIVSCAGPGTHEVAQTLDIDVPLPPLLRACNAVLTLEPPGAAVAVRSKGLGRMLFALPWGSSCILGTSEAPAHVLDAQRCAADVASLLEAFEEALPHLHVTGSLPTRIHRGLIPANPRDPRQPLEYSVLRRALGPGGTPVVLSMSAKWTTTRLSAERAVEATGLTRNERLPRARSTAGGSLRGAEGESSSPVSALLDTECQAMIRLSYGERAAELAPLLEAPGLARRLDAGSPVIGAQILHAIREEHAIHLDDILLRRIPCPPQGPAPRLIEEAASLAAREFGWSETKKRAEIGRVESELRFALPELEALLGGRAATSVR